MRTADLAAVTCAMEQLRSLIGVVPVRLGAIGDEQASEKKAADSWSKKQELGHLIDSASNNHQRVVRAQGRVV